MNRLHSTIRIGLPTALGLAAAALLLAVLAPARVQAAGVVGDGDTDQCTETELLAALAGGGLVTFNCGTEPHTITLSAPYAITADTTIDGGSKIILSGGGTHNILTIPSTATAHLYNLVFYNGRDFSVGGAIINLGTLVVSNTTFISNTASSDGGAIYSSGPLTVTESIFSVNSAGTGGAIVSSGPTTVISSTFYSNTADFLFGGAIAHGGPLDVTGSTFFANTSPDGGAIHGQSALTLTHSAVYSNFAQYFGGGLFAEGGPAYLYKVDVYGNVAGFRGGGMAAVENSVVVEQARFYNNVGDTSLNSIYDDTYGGGLYLAGGSATLRHVQIYGNRADARGGGLYSVGQLIADDVEIHHNTVLGPDGYGGGLSLHAPADLNNLRVYANTVVDGHANYGGGGLVLFDNPLTLTNSAVFSNTVVDQTTGAGFAQVGGSALISNTSFYSNTALVGDGGAVYVDDALALALINVTLSNNYAASGGGIFNTPFNPQVMITNSTIAHNVSGEGGAIRGDITLKNSVVAANTPANCEVEVLSAGYNVEDTNTCGPAGPGDVFQTDPLIGPLAYNGGLNPFNLTHALLEDSPAIDTADSAACPADDQRGVSRSLDGDLNGIAVCDRGAFEYELYGLFMAFLRRGP